MLKDVDCFARIKVDERTISCPFKEAKIDQAQIEVPIRRSVYDTKLQLRKKFKIEQHGKQMFIAGCTILPNGNMLIANYTENNVLMEYNEDGHFIRDIPVSVKPCDLTVIDTYHIAVSYNTSYYIEVINLKNMTVLQKVKFKDYCRGISHTDGKIYVVVRNEGIVVLDLGGSTLDTIKCDSADVYNITTSKTRIYYTQLKQNTIYCCNTTGEEIWNFKDKSLISPGGIAVDRDQNIFVVGIDSNNLMMIQNDGKVSKTLLTETDGLKEPMRLCYDKKKNILLVCNKQNRSAFSFTVI